MVNPQVGRVVERRAGPRKGLGLLVISTSIVERGAFLQKSARDCRGKAGGGVGEGMSGGHAG